MDGDLVKFLILSGVPTEDRTSWVDWVI